MSHVYDLELAPWADQFTRPPVDDACIPAERERRKAARAQREPYVPSRPVFVTDTTAGDDVPVRVYTPAGGTGSPLDGLLLIHGGGYCFGDLDMVHADALSIAAEVGTVVVSVDYRLAPEHPYPAGLEDCYTALSWTAAKAADLGIDPARLGVAGDSAGGGLAAALALLARDRSGPALCFQYLNVPELDDRQQTHSVRTFDDTPGLNRQAVAQTWCRYLQDISIVDDVFAVYAVPARVGDLSGLPPAHVVVCEFDPLRDEGIAYATRLLQAGVSTELHLYPGTWHGSVGIDSAISRRMNADTLDALRRGLHAQATS